MESREVDGQKCRSLSHWLLRDIVLIRLVIAGVLFAISACSAQPERVESKAIDVRVVEVGSFESIGRVSATGTVRFRRETVLGFTTSGRIAVLAVNSGDHVKKGQLLATLDNAVLNAQLVSATAEQVRAARELRRSKALFADGWVSAARVENAKAAFEAARAATGDAKYSTDTSRIFAPSAGIILARPVETSQIVGSGTPVLVLGEEAHGFVLKLSVPDHDALKLVVGASAEVNISSLGGQSLSGRIIQIGGRADQSTGTFDVEVSLPTLPQLRSGQIGNATMVAKNQTGSALVLLPTPALFAVRAGEGFVYVLPKGEDAITLRKVSIAEAVNDGVVVADGLIPGEWVVVSGFDRLRDKQRVRAHRRIG